MIYKFHKDETGYEQWLRDNEQGYVLNHFGTAEMNKMHHASCRYLFTTRHAGSRTNYEKICSLNYNELVLEANRITKNEWGKCKSCL
jgi:hypothetical protein